MNEQERSNQIAAAEAYEALFVPALFAQWGPTVIAAAGVGAGERALDVACGTGVLARALAERVGPAGEVAGLDPLPGMLAVAQRLAPEVTWHRGLAEALPFPDRHFDRVVSQFGLMFVSEREGALREAIRVLRPGGGLAFVVFAGLEHNPAYADEVALLERTAGRAAADALRAPFVLGDANELLQLAERAGVAGPDVRTVTGTARFPSVRALVEADLRGWLPVMGIDLPEERIAAILEEADSALERYVNGAGEAEFAVEALLLSGSRPS